MSIHPLPVFEADADPDNRSGRTDAEIYAALEAPKTMVVRFGSMKLIGEFGYGGDAKPGCGSKLVVRTHRGTELAEMLTTTCENAGCSKSVTRKELLGYIENSGGKDYPFHKNGRILRVATIEDLNEHAAREAEKPRFVKKCRELATEFKLAMKLVDVEPILGGELLTFYYMSETRVDFRELVRDLAAEFSSRIEMRQVGARDEARLVADYERCGQHCCCKNFLKVLKPVSMKAAKLQKATLDPLKISGRCGRLMCCLRYEDVSYRELKKNLPPRNSRVGTSEGPGTVVDSRILVQLVLVRLEESNREIAVPVEELMDPDQCPKPGERKPEPEPDPLRGLLPGEAEARSRGDRRKSAAPEARSRPEQKKPDESGDRGGATKKRRRRRRSRGEKQDEFRARSEKLEGDRPPRSGDRPPRSGDERKRPPAPRGAADGPKPPAPEGEAGSKKKRRRRRRRRGGGGGGSGGSGDGGGGGGGGGGGEG